MSFQFLDIGKSWHNIVSILHYCEQWEQAMFIYTAISTPVVIVVKRELFTDGCRHDMSKNRILIAVSNYLSRFSHNICLYFSHTISEKLKVYKYLNIQYAYKQVNQCVCNKLRLNNFNPK